MILNTNEAASANSDVLLIHGVTSDEGAGDIESGTERSFFDKITFAALISADVLYLCLTVWGISGVIIDKESRHDCGHQIWEWAIFTSVFNVLYVPYFAYLVYLMYHDLTHSRKVYIEICLILSIISSIIWSFTIWGNYLDSDCSNYWKNDYPVLYWFYFTMFWYYIGCVISFIICILGFGFGYT